MSARRQHRLQVAIRHPRLVRKLVFASSFTKRDGARPELWEFMKGADFSNMPGGLKDAFLRVGARLLILPGRPR
jgi:hypothetical protein